MNYEPRPIRNDDDYKAALSDIDALMDLEPAPGTAEFDRLELLAILIEDYEHKAFPIEEPDAHSCIKVYMEHNHLDVSDLAALIDDHARAKEILNNASPLTLTEIRALHKEWGISASILISGGSNQDKTEV